MKPIVIKFGLIAGTILAGMLVITSALMGNDPAAFEYGELIGYSSMVVAFLFVFFGIRAYRDRVVQGAISFGRGLKVGLLITLLACSMYVIAWEIIYFGFARDFMQQYTAHTIEQMREDGATDEAIATQEQEMAEFAALYDNPLFNVGITFLEVFPVGLIMTLISAGVLRRRGTEATAGVA